MARAIDVAQCIFTEYKSISGKTIDEMKLHKLLYLSQRESIAITNEPMFKENFEGWKYGPVCREVRNSYTEDGMFADDIREVSDEERYIVKISFCNMGHMNHGNLVSYHIKKYHGEMRERVLLKVIMEEEY